MTFGIGTATINFPDSALGAITETIHTPYAIAGVEGSISTLASGVLVSGAEYGSTVSNGSLLISQNGSGGFSLSLDGISWVSATSPLGGSETIFYVNGIFILVDNTTASNIWYFSTDGINWISKVVNLAGFGLSFSKLAYKDNVLVVQDQANPPVTYFSTNLGQSWTLAGSTGITASSTIIVLANTNRFICVCAIGNTYAYSTDGNTWTFSTLPASSAGWSLNSCVLGDRFFILDPSSNSFLVSSDGINWTTYTGPNGVQDYCLGYGGGNYLCSHRGSPTQVYLSPDLINWRQKALSASAGDVFFVCVLRNKLIALDSTNLVSEGAVILPSPTYGVGSEVITITPARLKVGTNTASVIITGVPDITSLSSIEAFMMGSDTTASHNGVEHEIVDLSLSVDTLVPGVGFTIHAESDKRLVGDFKVRYVWKS